MGNDMTTPELPPLPDPFVTAGLPQSGVLAHGYSAKQMHAYAESARAPLVEEVERLRAELATFNDALIETLLAYGEAEVYQEDFMVEFRQRHAAMVAAREVKP